jgi:hypothetical protein
MDLLILAIALACSEDPVVAVLGTNERIHVAGCMQSESGGRAFDIAVESPASEKPTRDIVGVDLVFDGQVAAVEAPRGWRFSQDHVCGPGKTRVRWSVTRQKHRVRSRARLAGFKVSMVGDAPMPCMYSLKFKGGLSLDGLCGRTIASAL